MGKYLTECWDVGDKTKQQHRMHTGEFIDWWLLKQQNHTKTVHVDKWSFPSVS